MVSMCCRVSSLVILLLVLVGTIVGIALITRDLIVDKQNIHYQQVTCEITSCNTEFYICGGGCNNKREVSPSEVELKRGTGRGSGEANRPLSKTEIMKAIKGSTTQKVSTKAFHRIEREDGAAADGGGGGDDDSIGAGGVRAVGSAPAPCPPQGQCYRLNVTLFYPALNITTEVMQSGDESDNPLFCYPAHLFTYIWNGTLLQNETTCYYLTDSSGNAPTDTSNVLLYLNAPDKSITGGIIGVVILSAFFIVMVLILISVSYCVCKPQSW